MKVKNRAYAFLLIATVHSAHGMQEPVYDLYRAMSNGNVKLVQDMVMADKNIINEEDFSGRKALHMAVEYGNLEITKWLVAHGVDIDSQASYYGQTALHYAVKYGHLEIVKWLLTHGADIDARDAMWNKAEHMVSSKNGKEIQLCLSNYREFLPIL